MKNPSLLCQRLKLTLSQTSPGFRCLRYKSFKNSVGNGEIARNEQFLLFPSCFLTFRRTFCHFHQIETCRLQTFSVWKCLKFVLREKGYKYLNVTQRLTG